eukprot:gene10898-2973_t
MTDAHSARLESIICKGFLLKRGSKFKSWKDRWFILDARGLLNYYKHGPDPRGLLGVIDLADVDAILPASLESWSSKGISPPKLNSRASIHEYNDCILWIRRSAVTLPSSIHTKTALSNNRRLIHKNIIGSFDVATDENPLDHALQFGWIMKMGSMVVASMISYAKDQNGLQQPLGRLHVRHIQEIKTADDCTWIATHAPKGTLSKSCFELVTAKRNFLLVCDTQDEANCWVNAIEGACLFYDLAFTFSTMHNDQDGDDPEERMSIALHDHDVRGSRAQSTRSDTDNVEDCNGCGWVWLVSIFKILIRLLGTILNCFFPHLDHEFMGGVSNVLKIDTELSSQHLSDVPVRLRRKTFSQAALLARKSTSLSVQKDARKIVVLYNPVSGTGQAKVIAEEHVGPILRLAKVDFEIVPTQYAGHATTYVAELDLLNLNGIAICGGDGLVSEVMTGLLNRDDSEEAKSFPVGIIPVGTANAMANSLDGGISRSEYDLISRSALAVAKGQTRLVDVLSILVSRRNLTHDSGTNEHHKTSTAQKFNRTDQPVVDTDRTSIPDVSTNFANDLGQSENITVKSSCDAICECSPDQKLCCASNVKSCTEHYNATEVEISYPRNEIESDIHSNQAKSAGKRAFKMACEASPYLAEVALDSVGFGLGSVLTSMIPGGDEDDDGSDSSSKSEDGDSSDSSNDRSSDDGRDVCVSPEQHLYALSCIGWGLTGACTARAQTLRWMPGQKKIRYDVAGFLTLVKDWPLICKCKFEYRDAETMEWHSEDIGIVNMIASNMDKLGAAHPICKDIKLDDGKLGITIIDDTHSRAGTVSAAMNLKKGKYLSDHKNVRTVITSEFRMSPRNDKANTIPFNVDGDPVSPGDIHVKVLRQSMRVFAFEA